VPHATRLVVVAPHPDDETLGAGGLVQRVLRDGGTVRIVALTSGDGFREAASGLAGGVEPTVANYRALGIVREGELRHAAAMLGVREVVTLAAPDGGLDALTSTHWASSRPYVSPASGSGPLSGDVLLHSLQATLATARPTLVVGPDPRDHHADHAAAGRLTGWAVASLSPSPCLLTYLVHDAVWPPPDPPDGRLPVPAGAAYETTPWVSFELTDGERATKGAALRAHRSQWPPLGGLLARFVRRNEVFAVEPGGRCPGD
jgi:LmbE family N-acetylglucosaminyl deacetylase